MTATSRSGADPMAALPLLAEAGVSVRWKTLDGRTAWIADPQTREVRISRAVPPEALLRCLVEALQVIADHDDVGAADERAAPRLVHSAAEPEIASARTRPALRVVPRA